jgi:hypothetical protein
VINAEIFLENLKEEDLLGDPSLYRRAILKWGLKNSM